MFEKLKNVSISKKKTFNKENYFEGYLFVLNQTEKFLNKRKLTYIKIILFGLRIILFNSMQISIHQNIFFWFKNICLRIKLIFLSV